MAAKPITSADIVKVLDEARICMQAASIGVPDSYDRSRIEACIRTLGDTVRRIEGGAEKDPHAELARRRDLEFAALERERRAERVAPLAAMIAPAFVSAISALEGKSPHAATNTSLARAGDLALALARHILDHAGDDHA